jgi:hypothetical protein
MQINQDEVHRPTLVSPKLALLYDQSGSCHDHGDSRSASQRAFWVEARDQ